MLLESKIIQLPKQISGQRSPRLSNMSRKVILKAKSEAPRGVCVVPRFLAADAQSLTPGAEILWSLSSESLGSSFPTQSYPI